MPETKPATLVSAALANRAAAVWFFLTLIVCGVAAGAGAQSVRSASARAPIDTPTLDSAQRKAIDSVFQAYDKGGVPGCALGVFRAGRSAYGRGYGWADLERRVPITTATLFDIGSTSKQFAAASIALLAEEHKLSFDDEVRKYIPELPDYGAPLTIDNLMRHTSGLRDYAGLLALAGHSLEEVTTDSQALALIVHQRHLNFPTGSRYGRGLFIDTYRGLRRVQHGGDWIGYHAAYARFPAQHTSIIVLCNSDGISPEGLDDRVADIVLANEFTIPKPNASAAAQVATTQDAERPATTLAGGYFASSTGDVFRIAKHDSGLVLEVAGQSFPLMRKGPLAYGVAGLPVSITFVVDSAKAARALWLWTGSSDSLEAERFVPARPSAAELQSYAGRYQSPELGVTWPITFAHGALTLGTTPSELMNISGALEPAMKGTFTAGGGTLQFVRDATGRVIGMTLSASRMRGIQFDRLPE